jgi:pimeloyl-ACP methyl ester carboxylesterase
LRKTFICLAIIGIVISTYYIGKRLLDHLENRWPREVKTVFIESSLDQTFQPSLFYNPSGDQRSAPLLVALHTWSGDYQQTSSIPYFKYCKKNGWIFIHPHCRGPNNNPDATGSNKVIQDILDAVAYAKNETRVNNQRIYLIGCSGGGYTALMAAAKRPDLWAGVSVWASISDLRNWYFESFAKGNLTLVKSLIDSCGGTPGQSEKVGEEYRKRSPINFLDRAAKLNIDINIGIHDGHNGSVPINHSLEAFNRLCDANHLEQYKLSEKEIEYFVKNQKIPEHLRNERVNDPFYKEKKVIFRRIAGPVRLTIFDGGHEIVPNAALNWLSKQVKHGNL